MKVRRKNTYSEVNAIITLSNKDTIEVAKFRRFGAPGWCRLIISAGDENHFKHGSRDDLPSIDEVEEYAHGLLRAVKEARRIESMQLED